MNAADPTFTLSLTPGSCAPLLAAVYVLWPQPANRSMACVDFMRLLTRGAREGFVVPVDFTSRVGFALDVRGLLVHVVRGGARSGYPASVRSAVKRRLDAFDDWLGTPVVDRVALLDVDGR